MGRVLKKCGTFVLVFVLSIPAAEVGFRLKGDRPSADLYGLYAQFEKDNYKLAPRVNTGAKWASGAFTVHTDGLGLRCDPAEQFGVKPGDQLDILFMGDSQGFGNGVNFEETIAGVVAGLAAKNGYKAANASVGGHTASNQLALVNWLIEEQKVKISNIVILMTPVMLSGCDGFTRAVVGPDGRLYGKITGFRDRMIVGLKQNSVVYGRLRDAVRNLGLGATPTRDAPFVLGVLGASDHETQTEEKLKTFLRTLIRIASSHGAKVSLVYVPLTVEVDSSDLEKSAEQHGRKLDKGLPSRLAAAAARDLQLPLRSLAPVLEKFHGEGRELHLTGDYHYGAALSQSCGSNTWLFLRELLNTSHFKHN